MKRILLGFAGLIMALGLFVSPALVQAGPFDAARDTACEGLEFNEGDSTSCDNSDGGRVNSTVISVINIASLVVGVIAVIMVVIGGMKYVTSQGDSNGITSAKNTIVYAIVGLVIVALSQIMVRFVINRTTDVNSDSSQTQPVTDPNGCDRSGTGVTAC